VGEAARHLSDALQPAVAERALHVIIHGGTKNEHLNLIDRELI
jgi:hypothetical protein